jgi:hypothetical protein
VIRDSDRVSDEPNRSRRHPAISVTWDWIALVDIDEVRVQSELFELGANPLEDES